MRRLAFEEQRALVQRDTLRPAGLAGPEPRPLVVARRLRHEPGHMLVERLRLAHVVDDQDDLGETATAHRCASYMPNSSRRALQISPTVQRARSASRIGRS